MEYFISRAMQVCQLSGDNYFLLEEKEKKVGRCLTPFEIQTVFRLPTIKEAYCIPPDNEQAQGIYMQGLRGQFRSKGLIPIGGDLSMTSVEEVHSYDEKIRNTDIDFDIGITRGRKKISSDFEN